VPLCANNASSFPQMHYCYSRAINLQVGAFIPDFMCLGGFFEIFVLILSGFLVDFFASVILFVKFCGFSEFLCSEIFIVD
jgi:hypothetical protein